jgi:hypothetical protein
VLYGFLRGRASNSHDDEPTVSPILVQAPVVIEAGLGFSVLSSILVQLSKCQSRKWMLFGVVCVSSAGAQELGGPKLGGPYRRTRGVPLRP